jgi:hypothetical protein
LVCGNPSPVAGLEILIIEYHGPVATDLSVQNGCVKTAG